MLGQLHVRYRAASIEESQSGNLSFGMIISAVRVTYRVHTPSNISSQCDLKSAHTSKCDLQSEHTFQYGRGHGAESKLENTSNYEQNIT